MPDQDNRRSSGYTQGDPSRRPQARPSGYHPNNYAAGQTNRPVNGQNRPMPQGSRPTNYNGRSPQPTGGARPAGGQSRPAGAPNRPPQGARPAGQNGQPRPAGQGSRPAGAPNRMPPQGGRPVNYGGRVPQGNRPANYPVPRPAGRPPQNAPRRSVSHPAGNGRPPRGSAGGEVPAFIRITCGVLSVLLLILICLAVTKAIRSAQPRPTITQTTQQPDASGEISQNTLEPQETPEVQQTPAPSDAPQNGLRRATIRAIGDVIIDEQMLENGEVGNEVYDFSPLFEYVHGVMSDADWTMINVDASFRRGRYGYSGFPTICTPPSILNVLKDCGVDMLTMCNNHALDRYFDGLKESLDLVDAAGLAHVGAYRTQEEFDTPEVYDINGIKVGMVNYTQYTNGMASQSDKEATIYGMRLMQGADYAGDIANLKGAGAEFVIAIMHWGEEYIRYPEADIEAVAKRLVAAGADLIIGGHPHVVQPAEYITATDANGNSRTALCIYSIGNYLSEHRTTLTDNGVIFEFTLQENEQGQIQLIDPNCIPVYMWQIDLGGGKYDYRVLPSGEYLNNPPSGMSTDQHERMKQSWNELVDLFAGVLPVNAN